MKLFNLVLDSSVLIVIILFKFIDGATLIFTSSKMKLNINVFYEYLLHRLYDFPLKHKSDTSNGESLFIPIGVED